MICVSALLHAAVLLAAATHLVAPAGVPAGPCRQSEITCGASARHRCITVTKYCDGIDDCGDGTDEPRSCTREHSFSRFRERMQARCFLVRSRLHTFRLDRSYLFPARRYAGAIVYSVFFLQRATEPTWATWARLIRFRFTDLERIDYLLYVISILRRPAAISATLFR